MFRRLRGDPEDPQPHEDGSEGTQGSPARQTAGPTRGARGQPVRLASAQPGSCADWARHMSTDGGTPQVVTEYPPGGGPGRTVATYVNGKPSQPDGRNQHDSKQDLHRPPRAAAPPGPAGQPCPPNGRPVIAKTADFEPETTASCSSGWPGRSPG